MEDRELKGLQIAAVCKVTQKDGIWYVPSQTGDGTRYQVNPGQGYCSCPDHEVRRVKCKHIWAVEFTIKREVAADGKVTETKTVRVTYSQNWTAYNTAQCEEKTQFAALLADLCKTVPQPPQTNGRPRLPMSDMAFACTFKVYTMFSARRFTSDLEEAKADGLIAKRPHFNSVSNYLANPALTSVLKGLIMASSLPLKAVETDFAVDSSGFGTSRFVRWYNKKYGRELDNREWVKVHLMCGVKTHTVTSAEISGWAANDTTYFAPLVEETAKHFQIAEVSADKAYLGHKNLAIVESLGATPFVPFKSNTVAATGDSAWAKMYHYYMFNRDTFLAHYHKRSNVETVFSMIKGKFGDSVRSKGNAAQVNEVLCKVLCHNICVLIQSMYELGVSPNFVQRQETVA
ncbi:MAG: transposase [Chloroflexi bacterium]|nr:transposase [Chloroflexota bacterium]